MRVWHKRIQEAHTWQELLQATRDYIAAFEPNEWHSVPKAARPDRIKGIDDIAYWHRRLEEEYLPVASRADIPDAFRAMLGFFRAASERAAEMHGSATPPHQDAENDGDGGTPRRESQSRVD
jgi:hypothetical protein